MGLEPETWYEGVSTSGYLLFQVYSLIRMLIDWLIVSW